MSPPSFSRDTVLHVARLARLHLDEPDVARMTHELGKILNYVQMLTSVNTSHVEPTAYVQLEKLPLRLDKPHEGLARDDVLAQAPRPSKDGFHVPTFVEE